MRNRGFLPKLVIFDCDGVLIDSEIIVSATEADELSLLGYKISLEDAVFRFAGVPAMEMRRTIEAEMGRALPSDFSERVENRVVSAYQSTLKPIAGVEAALKDLDIPVCVASSSSPSRLALGLIHTKLFDHFYPSIFSTALVANGKPSPDIFLFAATQMGAAPADCLVVEDSVAGVKAAVAAGMVAIGFVGGSHGSNTLKTKLYEAGATFVMEKFKELGTVIEQLGDRLLGATTQASNLVPAPR
ncbi:HAD family hydrolase [Rhizobium tubonense]|uniref:HAD family hydrolase n=1 Tax=Rhizobium tubonense TaxID=484088 RepID=UPI001FCEEA4A|nr:HAD-IA family hydrolase [Rhizobium tubonense]